MLISWHAHITSMMLKKSASQWLELISWYLLGLESSFRWDLSHIVWQWSVIYYCNYYYYNVWQLMMTSPSSAKRRKRVSKWLLPTTVQVKKIVLPAKKARQTDEHDDSMSPVMVLPTILTANPKVKVEPVHGMLITPTSSPNRAIGNGITSASAIIQNIAAGRCKQSSRNCVWEYCILIG